MALQTTACKLKGEKTNTKKYSNRKHRKFPEISISKAKSKWGKKKRKRVRGHYDFLITLLTRNYDKENGIKSFKRPLLNLFESF